MTKFIMLAQQQIDSVSAAFVKDFFITVMVMLGVVATIAGIWSFFRKPAPVKINDDPAIEVRKAPRRFNHELFESRHGEYSRRLDGHDAELEQIWNTMRHEDAAIRRETGEKFERIMEALGEIKGEIKKL